MAPTTDISAVDRLTAVERLNEPIVRWRIEDDLRLAHTLVAQHLGISAPYWSQILSGQRNPKPEHIEALANLIRLPRRVITGSTTLGRAA
jgi:transcriptional regulator with XRE-family HTH domain